jgi:fructose-1,6-bisphosphatase
MVAAGYTMYGSSCNLVLSTGQGVNGFTLDEVCVDGSYAGESGY